MINIKQKLLFMIEYSIEHKRLNWTNSKLKESTVKTTTNKTNDIRMCVLSVFVSHDAIEYGQFGKSPLSAFVSFDKSVNTSIGCWQCVLLSIGIHVYLYSFSCKLGDTFYKIIWACIIHKSVSGTVSNFSYIVRSYDWPLYLLIKFVSTLS